MADEVKQKLGPQQLAWVEALESGKYEQTKYKLFDGTGHCCLGVACRVSGMEPTNTTSAGQVVGYRFNNCVGSLPASVLGAMRFQTESGNFGEQAEESLAYMNDTGASFAEIAEFVRANPDKIFFGPA